MRRVAALVMTMGLAWLIVTRLGVAPAGSAALALGIALIAASVVGWLFAFLRLPRIAGYLAFGLICGPAVANIITVTMARDLRAASGLAIALIAFLAGLQFPVRRTGPSLPRMATLSAVTVAVLWLGLAAALFVFWPWLPIAPELTGLQRLAAVALAATVLAGVSPTITVAVIAEARSSGPLSTLGTTAAVLVELMVIVLFSILLEVARAVFELPGPAGWSFASAMAWTLGGSLAFGAALGAAFALYVQYIGREVTLALIALCGIIAGLGAQLHLEPLIAGVGGRVGRADRSRRRPRRPARDDSRWGHASPRRSSLPPSARRWTSKRSRSWGWPRLRWQVCASCSCASARAWAPASRASTRRRPAPCGGRSSPRPASHSASPC